MKKTSKALLLALCAIALVVCSVLGTLAYLTDNDSVTNTFTVGKVEIKLDEADVNTDGTYFNGHDTRVDANEYHLLPGHTYYKDPTVTVKANSEESYVRMLVTVTKYSQIEKTFDKTSDEFKSWYAGEVFLLQNLVKGWDSAIWVPGEVTIDRSADTATYEFRYAGTVAKATTDTVLDDLFEEIVVPGSLNNAAIANLQDITIDVVAHAIQADGFSTADAAWTAFNGQVNPEYNP